MALMIDLTSMRVKQHKAIPAELLVQAEKIGLALARLRVARNVTQEVAGAWRSWRRVRADIALFGCDCARRYLAKLAGGR